MKKLFSVSFEEVVSVENLCSAWQEFIRGKRKKKDVQEFILHLGDEIASLHSDLMSGEYVHGGYRYFRMNDPKPRDIHKASVRDRLLHHAIHRKLYPFFANNFIFDSFSCQNNKGLHRVIKRFEKFSRKISRNSTRTCWILKCDIRKFFASIDHYILTNILRGRILDSRLFNLLEQVIRSFEICHNKGIPLGNLTSQLFANIYMNEFDQFVKHNLHIKYYIRYADDFVLMSNNRFELLDCLPKITTFLSRQLDLSLHPNKIFIKTLASGVDFLGWVHFPYHRVLRTKTKIRMKRLLGRCQSNHAVESYLGMLTHGDAYRLSSELKNLCWLFAQNDQ
ncbi:group II intron reverse transcriptase domain-containing protein [Candidatus Uhrbacteria bacterium]|nr:group II intron reverse transcriptase domain-containing protein [Candidatus Uhrbacteria bacterium]